MNRVSDRAAKRWLLYLLLAGIISVGGWLRWSYAHGANLFVDEFSTILASQGILRHGWPLLPTGSFYGHGLIFSYLEAVFIGAIGVAKETIRAPSLAASILALPLAYAAGRRMFSWKVGLLAATLLCLDSESIIWGGRARAYALLQTLALSSFALAYIGAIRGDSAKLRLASFLFLTAAILTHAEAMLLLPALLLGLLVIRGWRRMIRLDIIIGAAICGAASLATIFLARWVIGGQLIGIETLDSRPLFSPSLSVGRALVEFAPFFLEDGRWVATLLIIAGLLLAFTLGRDRRGAHRKALIFAGVLFGATIGQMIFLVGDTWWSPRYLFMLILLYFLIVAGAAEAGLDALVSRLRWSGSLWKSVGAFAAVMAASFILLWPSAWAASQRQEQGYESAFSYVRDRWQPGDVIVSINPAASHIYLGRSDFFAIQDGYQEYVMRRDDIWVDRWTGAPLLRSVEDLKRVLEESERTWFVVDERRLRQRFDPAFAQALWRSMDLVFKEDEAMVFVSLRQSAPAVSRPLQVNLGGEVALVGYQLGRAEMAPSGDGWGDVVVEAGDSLALTLEWQALKPLERSYSVFVHVIDQEGQAAGQSDGIPAHGLQPTWRWIEGETIFDRRQISIAPDPKLGRYQIVVGLYDLENGERLSVADGREAQGDRAVLDYVQVLSPSSSPSQPSRLLGANLGDEMMLWGYDLPRVAAKPGEAITVRLYWRSQRRMDSDYTVFMHLLREDETILTQSDGQPLEGFYPTSYWDPGEVIEDPRLIAIPENAPPGQYVLTAGMYLLETGARLPVLDETGAAFDDRVLLEMIQVEGTP